MDRADIDDPARLFGLSKVADDPLGGEECSLKVDVHDSVIFLLCHVPEFLPLFDPGVVDQYVDPARRSSAFH